MIRKSAVSSCLVWSALLGACSPSILGDLSGLSKTAPLAYIGQSSVQLSTPYFISGSPLNEIAVWIFPVDLGQGKFMVFHDIFDPITSTWTKDVNSPFWSNSASTSLLLNDGRVFMLNGQFSIYSPNTQSWTALQTPLLIRDNSDAQLLPNGKSVHHRW